jgi:MoxR-like ATPase
MEPEVIADRREVLRLYDSILRGVDNKRILLLEADGGMGKSALLRDFRRRTNARCVAIDLRGNSTGLPEIFDRIYNTLEWERFHNFTQRISKLGSIDINNNVMIGSNEISIYLQGADEAERSERRIRLMNAFFKDLRAIKHQVVLLFDTFDQASPEIREWLQNVFMSYVVRASNLIVVVAGQTVPASTIEWFDCSHQIQLEGIHDVDAWWDWAQRMGVTETRDWVRAVCQLLHGHPSQIRTAFSTFCGI